MEWKVSSLKVDLQTSKRSSSLGFRGLNLVTKIPQGCPDQSSFSPVISYHLYSCFSSSYDLYFDLISIRDTPFNQPLSWIAFHCSIHWSSHPVTVDALMWSPDGRKTPKDQQRATVDGGAKTFVKASIKFPSLQHAFHLQLAEESLPAERTADCVGWLNGHIINGWRCGSSS